MAEYNGIQEGGLNSVLNRRLNTEAGAPAPNLAPEVLPIFEAAQYTDDLDFYAGVRNCSGYANQGATVANNSGVRLRNPVGSKTIVVLRLIVARCTTEVFGGLSGTGLADLANLGVSSLQDSRYPITTAALQTVARLTSGTAGTPIFTTQGRASWTLLTPTTETEVRDLRVVLHPGNSYDIWTVAQNLQLICNLRWSERSMNQNELG